MINADIHHSSIPEAALPLISSIHDFFIAPYKKSYRNNRAESNSYTKLQPIMN
jgi:hypothetical protein